MSGMTAAGRILIEVGQRAVRTASFARGNGMHRHYFKHVEGINETGPANRRERWDDLAPGLPTPEPVRAAGRLRQACGDSPCRLARLAPTRRECCAGCADRAMDDVTLAFAPAMRAYRESAARQLRAALTDAWTGIGEYAYAVQRIDGRQRVTIIATGPDKVTVVARLPHHGRRVELVSAWRDQRHARWLLFARIGRRRRLAERAGLQRVDIRLEPEGSAGRARGGGR